MKDIDLEGERNPAWKGGHKLWQPGKHGRDKDGLSWKIQRQLALDRDHYRCQYADQGGCSNSREKTPTWRPDVHHIRPYRLSFSHSLDNLICLCRHHHKVAEAQITELWGGKTFGGAKRSSPRCAGCGSDRRKLKEGLCGDCSLSRIILPYARALQSQGLTFSEIGRRLGVKRQAIRLWLLGQRRRGQSGLVAQG